MDINKIENGEYDEMRKKRKSTKRNLPAIILLLILLLTLGACGESKTAGNKTVGTEVQNNGTLEFDYSMELRYAKNFSVDYYKGGYKLITINDEQKFLTVPENMKVPDNMEEGVTVLQMPIDNIMVSSAPTMSLINAIGCLDKVSLTTGEYESWYIEEIKNKMNSKEINYVGSYKDPDYEMLIAESPKVSVFSSMLSTTPEVAKKFEELNLPYFVDGSTYEEEPMARVEWVKLYGALYGCEEKAQTIFEEQVKYVESLGAQDTGKTVSIFYVTSSGVLYARQGGDYVAKMAEMAGGKYIPESLARDKTGTQKMGFEDFYKEAKDSDYIVYIWSIGGKPENLDALIGINSIFADFKAVREGNVWCTTPDFFQISDTLGYMVKDINSMLTGTSKDKLTYLFKLAK